MRPKPEPGNARTSAKERGAAILIVAVAVAAAAGITAASRLVQGPEQQVIDTSATGTDLRGVVGALKAYAAENGYLPCPADPALATGAATAGEEQRTGGACDTSAGAVPWRDLGIAQDEVLDGWGRRVTYVVDADLASSSGISCPGDLTIIEGNVTPEETLSQPESGYAVALISHGPDGAGSYGETGERYSLGGAPGQAENYDTDETVYTVDDGVFDDRVGFYEADDFGLCLPSEDPDDTILLNDDTHIDQNFLSTTSYGGGPSDKRTFEVLKDKALDGGASNALAFGSDPEGDDVYGTNTEQRASCVWIGQVDVDEPDGLAGLPFTTETLRMFTNFQFYPGEVVGNDTGYGEGFTFTVLPGDTDVSDADRGVICGRSNNSNEGLGYKGILSGTHAKFAVKFDIYNNGYGGEGTLDRNHASVLHKPSTDNRDWVGNGSGPNPPCGNGGNGLTHRANGTCTFLDPVADAGDQDVSDYQAWMERRSGETFDYIDGGFGGPVIPVRIDIARCNAGCGTCNVADGRYPRFRAYIGCTEDSCDDLSSDYASNPATSDIPFHTIDHCMPNPLIPNGNTTMDTITPGLTASFNGSGMGLLITDLKIVTADP